MRYKAKHGPLKKLLLYFRDFLMRVRAAFYRRVLGMNISPSCLFSLRTNLDLTNPKGVHIGDETYLAFGVVVFTHDMSREFHANTYIGSRCFVGANSIIMPGVRVGNGCIIGSASVVTKDVPDNCIVGGNPARILKSGIVTKKYGIIVGDLNDNISDVPKVG